MIRINLRIGVGVSLLVVLLGGLFFWVADNNSKKAFASGSFPSDVYLISVPDGMSLYATSIQQSTSASTTLQAISDWDAKQASAPTLTSQPLADAVTNLVNAKLVTMTASDQETLFEQMMFEDTPRYASL